MLVAFHLDDPALAPPKQNFTCLLVSAKGFPHQQGRNIACQRCKRSGHRRSAEIVHLMQHPRTKPLVHAASECYRCVIWQGLPRCMPPCRRHLGAPEDERGCHKPKRELPWVHGEARQGGPAVSLCLQCRKCSCSLKEWQVHDQALPVAPPTHPHPHTSSAHTTSTHRPPASSACAAPSSVGRVPGSRKDATWRSTQCNALMSCVLAGSSATKAGHTGGPRREGGVGRRGGLMTSQLEHDWKPTCRAESTPSSSGQ